MKLFKPNEHTKDYHINKNRTIKTFHSKSTVKKYIFKGEEVFTFETKDMIVKYSLDLGFNGIKFQYDYGGTHRNTYFIFHQKLIHMQGYETSTEKKRVGVLI